MKRTHEKAVTLDETTMNALSSLAWLYKLKLARIPIRNLHMLLTNWCKNISVMLVLSISFLSVSAYGQEALESDEKAGKEIKSAVSRYWLNQKALDALPEPKPLLTPQCSGVFFQGKTLADQQKETMEISQDSESQTISADRALYQADGTAIFEGNVILNQGAQAISGEYVRYDQEKNLLDISGNVQIEEPGLVISSEKARYNNETRTTELEDAEFLLFENGLNGYARSIRISENLADINRNSITSCPPGKENWLLKSEEMHLDQEKGWGYAKNASLHLAKVPVLYTPYFTFPLDDRRKSGFLYPSLGSDSINGVDVAVPYYLNIAPNYDATLTPRTLSKRGDQIGAEFRYLNITGQGQISGDYLGQDELNPVYSERKQGQWHHRADFRENWFFNADYYYVSDPDYLDDLDSLSNNNSLRYLDRNASLSYFGADQYLTILVQDFQILDVVNELKKPYRLAPQINAGTGHNVLGSPLSLNIDSQISRFERDVDPLLVSNNAIAAGKISTGNRLVVQPGLKADFSSPAYFLRPAARLHHRQYQLEDYQALDQEEELSSDVPIYSIDSGLVFERDLTITQRAYTQTLEPRIKFLKIPYKDQSEIPDFDTGLLTFSQEQVFRDRRYSGHDLVGDTEQLSVGVSSLFYDEQGNENASLALGQIVYLEDREIQLKNKEDPEAELSPLAADATVRLIDNWKLSQKVLWNSEDNHLDQLASGIYFKDELNRIFNVEYRYRPKDLGRAQKETQTSFVWPVSNRWKAISYWNYNLIKHSTTEVASGLEYENCCVIVRALNQKWLRRNTATSDYESANKQSLEIHLKGLGKLNDQISQYLESKIPGFNE